MIGKSKTSEGKIFSQQEMSVAIKKIIENKAADESGGQQTRTYNTGCNASRTYHTQSSPEM